MATDHARVGGAFGKDDEFSRGPRWFLWALEASPIEGISAEYMKT